MKKQGKTETSLHKRKNKKIQLSDSGELRLENGENTFAERGLEST